MKHTSSPSCKACTANEHGGGVKAIINPNACDSECRCECHGLWAKLRAANVPIGKPDGA